MLHDALELCDGPGRHPLPEGPGPPGARPRGRRRAARPASCARATARCASWPSASWSATPSRRPPLLAERGHRRHRVGRPRSCKPLDPDDDRRRRPPPRSWSPSRTASATAASASLIADASCTAAARGRTTPRVEVLGVPVAVPPPRQARPASWPSSASTPTGIAPPSSPASTARRLTSPGESCHRSATLDLSAPSSTSPCELADLADAVTLPRFRAADLTVDHKADPTEVTEADRGAEAAIRAALTAARPDHAVLGEEEGLIGPADADARWVIDPIDGTSNYVRGVPIWATLIALQHEGEVVVGVASAPALGRRWWAAAGLGRLRRRPARSTCRRWPTLAEAHLAHAGVGTWFEHGRGEPFVALTPPGVARPRPRRLLDALPRGRGRLRRRRASRS